MEKPIVLTAEERANICQWLIKHTSYEKDKSTGKYFWEPFKDEQLYAVYRKLLEEGYSTEVRVRRTKKGEKKIVSYLKLIMDFQQRAGLDLYTEEDLRDIKIDVLKDMCYRFGLIPEPKKKVKEQEPAPTETITSGRAAAKKISEGQISMFDMMHDADEEVVTLEEAIQMFGIEITDETLESIESRGIKIIDAQNGKLPYSPQREELREKMINFIIMSRAKDYRGNPYKRKHLMQLSTTEIRIIYEGFRAQLNEQEQKKYPAASELESGIRFGQ